MLSFVTAERLRSLVNTLSEDIDRRVITLETHGVESLIDSVAMLQQRLKQKTHKKSSKRKSKVPTI